MKVAEVIEKWTRAEIKPGDAVEVEGFIVVAHDECWVLDEHCDDLQAEKDRAVYVPGDANVLFESIPFSIAGGEYWYACSAVVRGSIMPSDVGPYPIALVDVTSLKAYDDELGVFESTLGKGGPTEWLVKEDGSIEPID